MVASLSTYIRSMCHLEIYLQKHKVMFFCRLIIAWVSNLSNNPKYLLGILMFSKWMSSKNNCGSFLPKKIKNMDKLKDVQSSLAYVSFTYVHLQIHSLSASICIFIKNHTKFYLFELTLHKINNLMHSTPICSPMYFIMKYAFLYTF